MRKIDIFIPDNEYKIGGPATFMKNFITIAQKKKYRFSKNIKNIFFPISFDLKKLDKIKKDNGIIIQRLDGIYYPSKHGEDYRELNKNIEIIYKHYSTHVVFQSEYSKKQCFSMFGEHPSYSIIFNGTNKDIFYQKQNRDCREKKRLITTGNFRNQDMLEPVIKALDFVVGDYDFELCVLGPVVDSLKKYLNRPYCRYLGIEDNQYKIANYLRDSDAFIYSHLNPPCPNSVIEAISCGLPVIGFNSGAMGELCSFNKELLAPISNNIFQEYKDFDTKKLSIVIKKYLDESNMFNERAQSHSHLYDMHDCVAQYINVFEKLGCKTNEQRWWNSIFHS